MSRIPAVGVEHVVESSLLTEVASLRTEVRTFTAVGSEIAAIRDSFRYMQNNISSDTSQPTTSFTPNTVVDFSPPSVAHTDHGENVSSDAVISVPSSSGGYSTTFSSSDTGAITVLSTSTASSGPSRLFADVASSLRDSGITERSREKRSFRPVVGCSTKLRLQFVVTKRTVDTVDTVDVFVTRLQPDTERIDVLSSVTDVLMSCVVLMLHQMTSRLQN